MRWFLAIFVFSTISLIGMSLGALEVLKIKREKDKIFRVMSLRENLAYVLLYYGKNDALVESHLNISKGLALEIGYEKIISLVDSLEKTIKSKAAKNEDLRKFEGKIKAETEELLTGGESAVYWLYAPAGAVLILLSSLFSILGFLEFRRNLKTLKNFFLDLRLGILWEKVDLDGDFEVLEGILNGLLRDVNRMRKNVQKVTRS